MEGFLRYIVQILLSLMTYQKFIPYHVSTDECDTEFNNLGFSLKFLVCLFIVIWKL